MKRKPSFSEFLERQIRRSGISGRDVAKRAGLSHGLLSMLLNGNTVPTLKVAVLLAWALNSNPANLYREILQFLMAAEHLQDVASVRQLSELLEDVAESDPIWIYAPDDPEVLEVSKNLLTKEREKPFREVYAFTRIEHARIFWKAEEDRDGNEIETRPRFMIKTPPENLLTRSGPLMVLHPNDEARVKLYRWLPDLDDRMIELPMTPNNLRFVKTLEAESRRRNVYELATFEKDEALRLKEDARGAEVVVIIYTQTFPELEEQYVEHRRLQRAVSGNLKEGIRYLYVSTEHEKISEIHFSKLKFILEKLNGSISTRSLTMLAIGEFDDLRREETLVVYAVAQKQVTAKEAEKKDPTRRSLLPLTFISQEEGLPVRFAESDVHPIRMEFIDKILEKQEVKDWLNQAVVAKEQGD